ncbi:MAG: GIY-YIG nuclease family protein [bacterium]
MSYFVYILFSKKDKRLYVGCTSDLSKRLGRHERGEVLATKDRRPVILIHHELFDNKTDAFNRERFLKSLWGGRFKKKILNNYLNKIGHGLK